MKKIKVIPLLLIIISCCSGWTGTYTLKQEKSSFNENIVYEFEYNVEEKAKEYFSMPDGEFFESNIVYGNIYAIDNEGMYTRIVNSAETSTVTLNYTYSSFTNLRKAKYASICFDEYNTEETDQYYYINLKGEYTCQGKGIQSINLITTKKLEGNYQQKFGNKYIWNILDTNNNIEIKIYKEIFGNEVLKVSALVIGIGLIICLIIFLRNKRVNKI